jgi:hypothetical protein
MIIEAISGGGLAHALLAGPALLFAAAGLSAASSIFSGYSQMQQEKATAAAAEANAKETGRALASEDAIAERQQSALVGDTLAAAGSSGVTLSGSALDVTRQNLVESEYERLRARRERAMQIDNLKYEAAAAKGRGKQAMFGGILGAAGSAANILSPQPGAGLGGGKSGSFIGTIKKTYQP